MSPAPPTPLLPGPASMKGTEAPPAPGVAAGLTAALPTFAPVAPMLLLLAPDAARGRVGAGGAGGCQELPLAASGCSTLSVVFVVVCCATTAAAGPAAPSPMPA